MAKPKKPPQQQQSTPDVFTPETGAEKSWTKDTLVIVHPKTKDSWEIPSNKFEEARQKGYELAAQENGNFIFFDPQSQKLWEIPEDKAEEAEQKGLVYTTKDQLAQYDALQARDQEKARFQDAATKAQATLEGVREGVSAGFYDPSKADFGREAWANPPSEQEQKELTDKYGTSDRTELHKKAVEHQPDYYLGGEIAGSVASIFLPGGVAKTAGSLGRAAGGAILKNATGTLAQTASRVAAGTAEAATMSATQAIGNVVSSDKPFKFEEAVEYVGKEMGYGALFGGGLSLAGMALGQVIKSARKATLVAADSRMRKVFAQQKAVREAWVGQKAVTRQKEALEALIAKDPALSKQVDQYLELVKKYETAAASDNVVTFLERGQLKRLMADAPEEAVELVSLTKQAKQYDRVLEGLKQQEYTKSSFFRVAKALAGEPVSQGKSDQLLSQFGPPAIGAILGSLTGQGMLLGGLVGHAFKGVIGAAVKKAVNAKLDKLAGKSRRAFSQERSAAIRAMGNAHSAYEVGVPKILDNLSRWAGTTGGLAAIMSQKEYHDLTTRLDTIANGGGSLQTEMHNTLSTMGLPEPVVADVTQRSVDTVAFIHRKLSSSASSTNPLKVLQKTRNPTPSQLRAATDYVNAALNPWTVLDSIAHGTVNKEQIETLQELHPQVYDYLKDRLQYELSGLDEVPREVQQQALVILGQRKQGSGVYQELFKGKEGQQQQPLGGDSARKTPQNFQTPNQQGFPMKH